MFSKFKSRRGRLEECIKKEMRRYTPKFENIVKAVDEYEINNIDTIEKLKRDKKVDMNRINGALKQTINAHGPITKELIGSAGKRIYGSIMINPNQDGVEEKKSKISLRDVLLGIVLGTIITTVIILIL